MRKGVVTYCLLLTFFVSGGFAWAQFFPCGHEEEASRSGYPYDSNGDTIKIAVIYVAFPNPEAPDSVLTPEHEAAFDTLKWYFDSHSHGKLTFTEDSGIVLKPGESFGDPQNLPTAWVAEDIASSYRSNMPIPPGYPYEEDIEGWYDPGKAGARLNAEILFKIREAYGDTNSPFFGVNRLVINYIHPSPGVFPNGVGGYSIAYINADSLPSFFEFEKNNEYSVDGSQQNVDNGEPGTLDAADLAYSMAHEAGHGFGLLDGPPNLYSELENEEVYYYGSLNLMCQQHSDGSGLPPIGTAWLQYIPWQEGGNSGVLDVTGTAFRDTLFDIRSPRGKILKFRCEDDMYEGNPIANQYFLFAYHAGTGIDGVLTTTGKPVVRSKGLEVLHCVGNSSGVSMVDLESSFGLFADPGDTAFVLGGENWSDPDTETGYDNHDRWDTGGFLRSPYEYADYIGEEFDFFRINFTGQDTLYNKGEFSHNSNPNCYWYSSGSGQNTRRYPQDVKNSLKVEIVEQNDNEGWMIVDLITAPYADLIFPSPTQIDTFAVGDTIYVQWDHEFEDDISAIDILFYPFDDGIPQYIVLDYPVNNQVRTFPWVVGEENVTSDGLFEIRFKNPFSNYVDSDSASIVIEGDIYPAELFLLPAEGDELFAGVANLIRWTNRFIEYPADTLLETQSVDFLLSTEGGATGSWSTVAEDINFSSSEDSCVYSWTPDLDMESENAKLKLVFHTKGGDVASVETGFTFPIFPLAASFEDNTSRLQDYLEDLGGKPYGAIAFDYDGDGVQDLFVSVDDPGVGFPGQRSVLLKNEINQFGYPNFSKHLYDQPSPTPYSGAHGVAIGDFDQDGDKDLFLTNTTNPELYENNNGFSGQTASFFSTVPDSLLQDSYTAAWVDFDHDGDLDLFVGRAGYDDDLLDPGFTPLLDSLFENQGPDSNYSFVEVGRNVGLISSQSATATMTSVWCDVDSDHLWEVFVGDASSHNAQSQVYEQQPTGEFEIVPNALPYYPGSVSSAKWVDVDNSGTLELVVLSENGQLIIYDNFNSGFSGFRVINNVSGEDFGAVDFDLDGWVDILSSGENHAKPTLLMNLQGNSTFSGDFQLCSPGINSSGDMSEVVGGLVISDFTNDGDLDVFVANGDGANRYFHNSSTDGEEGPSGHWVGISLENCSTDPFTNLGAVVSVSKFLDSQLLGTQQIDGGSGRGGQNTQTLIFGLGAHGDNPNDCVSVDIVWPNGERMEDYQILASQFDSVVSITRNTEFSIDASSVKVVATFDINEPGVLDFTFTWNTDGLTLPENDEVTITPISGSGCPFSTTSLTSLSPGVLVQEPQYVIDLVTGLSSYEHQLIWQNVTCSPGCGFHYSVASAIGQGCQEDVYTAIRPYSIKVCPTSN